MLGATEYGQRNSALLIIAHFVFYFACIAEGYTKGFFYCDELSMLGAALMTFAMCILYTVIFSLGKFWTVKLFIAKKSGQSLNRGLLFKVFKHPNYYLSIVPELIGLGLFLHASYSLIIGFPLYIILLAIRIKMEEHIMKQYFQNY